MSLAHSERWRLRILSIQLQADDDSTLPFGTPRPYGLDAIRHHEQWFGHHGFARKLQLGEIEPVLEQDPLIIPPVLTKSGLIEQPVLRFLWSKAFEVLTDAQQAIFIGYSMPITDLCAGYLFREGLRHLMDDPRSVTVVDFAADNSQREEKLRTLSQAYRKVFPNITEDQFDFTGARSWVFNNLVPWLFDSKGKPIALRFGHHVISRSGVFIGTITTAIPIVWGPTREGQSAYAGQIERDRLFFRKDQEGSLSQNQISAPLIPSISRIPDPIEPKSLPENFRDLDLNDIRREG